MARNFIQPTPKACLTSQGLSDKAQRTGSQPGMNIGMNHDAEGSRLTAGRQMAWVDSRLIQVLKFEWGETMRKLLSTLRDRQMTKKAWSRLYPF